MCESQSVRTQLKAIRTLLSDLAITLASSASSGISSVDVLPTPTSLLRGSVRLLKGGTGQIDILYLCVKNSADEYEWYNLSQTTNV